VPTREFKYLPIISADEKRPNARWWIDTPLNAASCAVHNDLLEIKGWVLSSQNTIILIRTSLKTYEFQLTEERPDVLTRLLTAETIGNFSSKCGFDIKIQFEEHLDFGLKQDGCEYWIQAISAVARPKVLIGTDNWLFLDNDTNRSVDQFRGKFTLSTETILRWRDYYNWIRKKASDADLTWQFFVAPAKEELFPDFYPFNRGKTTPIDQFLHEFKLMDNIVYPLTQLHEARELSYYRTDTHWSDYGAYLGAIDILRGFKLGSHSDRLINSFKAVSSKGDLGSKLFPEQTSTSLLLSNAPTNAIKIFDNGISNIGRIWIYENIKSSTEYTLLIFGDSFSVNLIAQLACVFRRIVYAHTAATFDQSIVDQELPDFLLLQTNQRFLARPPEANQSIWDTIHDKLLGFTPNDLILVTNHMNKQQDQSSIFYTKKMLEQLYNQPHHHP
jgi:alginate O-acetyltransferase complex protein AlgJ